MKILLTGGSGLLGGSLLRRLHDRHEFVALCRRPPSPERAGFADWVSQDLSQPLDANALPAEIDTVVHLAQSSRYREFPEGAEDVFAVNIKSSFHLLEYARQANARTFVLASTGGIYAYKDQPIRETDPIAPSSQYFRSKYCAELLAENYRSAFATVIMRPFFIYGPGQNRMLIPRLTRQIRGDEEIIIEGNPGLRINPIHVEDTTDALEAALGLERSGVFNVAGKQTQTISNLVELIGELTKREPKMRHSPNNPPGDLVGDISQMQAILGVTPRISLRDGLRGMLDVSSDPVAEPAGHRAGDTRATSDQ